MLIIPFSIVTVTLRLIWQLLYLCTDADALSVEIVKFWVSTNTYVFVVVYLVVNDFSGGENAKNRGYYNQNHFGIYFINQLLKPFQQTLCVAGK